MAWLARSFLPIWNAAPALLDRCELVWHGKIAASLLLPKLLGEQLKLTMLWSFPCMC
jgi:hypothetical protein